MKKLLVVLTVLCLVFSMAAMAEGDAFTIRNGVQFGMTQDVVHIVVLVIPDNGDRLAVIILESIPFDVL